MAAEKIEACLNHAGQAAGNDLPQQRRKIFLDGFSGVIVTGLGRRVEVEAGLWSQVGRGCTHLTMVSLPRKLLRSTAPGVSTSVNPIDHGINHDRSPYRVAWRIFGAAGNPSWSGTSSAVAM